MEYVFYKISAVLMGIKSTGYVQQIALVYRLSTARQQLKNQVALVFQRTDKAVSFEPLSLLWKLNAHPASFLWTDLREA